MARKLVVEIVGDTSQLEKSYRRAEQGTKRFGQSVEKAGRGALVASVGFHGLGRAVGFASASFLGGAGFVAAVKAGFGEMMAGQAVAADTAAVLKSTGRVAGVSAKQVQALATSMQQLTGYDDEAIASAENLILTFTNVRNVAGKNNDVFTQATRSTLDLSRRFDQDLSTSAVQLGKALQDPIRGVTALRRAGVSFSTAQQQTINQLVRTGHVLEAQKIILREVRTETGGAAAAYGKTMAGQVDILQGNLTNLAGELATVVNPEVKKLTDRFNKWLENPENKQKVIDGFTTSVHGLGDAFTYTASATDAAAEAYKKYRELGRSAGTKSKGGGLLNALFGSVPEQLGYLKKQIDVFQEYLGLASPAAKRGAPTGLRGPQGKPGMRLLPGLQGPVTSGGAAPPGTPAAIRRTGASVSQRNQWFDAMISRQLGRVQDITSLKGQISRLGEIAALIQQRLKVTKDVTRQLTLEDQLLDVLRTQRQTRSALTDMIKQQAKDAADAAKAARQAAIDTKMGWLDFAVERAEATKPIKDDVKAQQDIIAFLKTRMRHEKRTLELVRGIWEARQRIRDLNKSKSDVDPLAGLMQVGSSRLAGILAAGTGLDARGRRILGANIAGAEIQPLHVHVNIDGREVGRAVTKDQARTGRRTARQTSGQRG